MPREVIKLRRLLHSLPLTGYGAAPSSAMRRGCGILLSLP